MNARDRGASSSITTRVCLPVASNDRVFFSQPPTFARPVAVPTKGIDEHRATNRIMADRIWPGLVVEGHESTGFAIRRESSHA